MVHHADGHHSTDFRFCFGLSGRFSIEQLLDFRGIADVCRGGGVLVARGLAANSNGKNASACGANKWGFAQTVFGVCAALGVIGLSCICGDAGGVLLDGGQTHVSA